MFRRLIVIFVTTLLMTCYLFVGNATATELNEATRTVLLNDKGETSVLSITEVKAGKRLFSSACADCHLGGVTKTNQNVGLDPETLALATPPRNNLEGIVDYLKNPTTYDGEIEISELHPSTKSADIFTEMRNISDEQLREIAGYILVQPKVAGKQWGGGKIYF
ncbi:photosystem II cytochrome c-550 [Richelia intracellularis]|nr:photosystem II cytochrome c-550 [Richelia intracellularis]HAE05873.1 cytochrome c-550 [Richelia sp.]